MHADERRERRRYRVTLPVAIDVERPDADADAERVGLSRDASVSGVLFNTRSRFAPGDELELTLHLSPSEERRVRARVVRVETVPRDSNFLWRYLTAVRFDEPVPDLETTLAASAHDRRKSHPDATDVA